MKKDYQSLIEKTLSPLPRHMVVVYAIACARDSAQYSKDPKEIHRILDIVEAYNQGKATKEELDTAYAYAASAFYARAACFAASSASYASYAAFNAASAAASAAAYAASSGKGDKTYDSTMEKYYHMALNLIESLTELEKELM